MNAGFTKSSSHAWSLRESHSSELVLNSWTVWNGRMSTETRKRWNVRTQNYHLLPVLKTISITRTKKNGKVKLSEIAAMFVFFFSDSRNNSAADNFILCERNGKIIFMKKRKKKKLWKLTLSTLTQLIFLICYGVCARDAFIVFCIDIETRPADESRTMDIEMVFFLLLKVCN